MTHSSAEVATKVNEHLEAAALLKELADGYEKTGHTEGEIREYVRANWHQNQAILLILMDIGGATA